MGENGKVIVMRFMEGQASTSEREEGCLEAIKKHPGIKILVDNRYAGATANEAQNTAMNIIEKIRQPTASFARKSPRRWASCWRCARTSWPARSSWWASTPRRR